MRLKGYPSEFWGNAARREVLIRIILNCVLWGDDWCGIASDALLRGDHVLMRLSQQ